MNHGVIEFFDFGFAPTTASRKRNLALLSLTVDFDAIRGLAHIALLATHQRKTEKRLFSLALPDMTAFTLALAAEAHPLFELFLLFRSTHLTQFFSGIEIRSRGPILPAFPNPAEQFRGVEKTVAAINQRGGCAVNKLEITGVAPLVRACFVPDPCHRANASYHAPADQTHDIDVMRSLVQHHAAAGCQLMLHPRPVHEFVVVPGIDHAKFAELAAVDDLAH